MKVSDLRWTGHRCRRTRRRPSTHFRRRTVALDRHRAVIGKVTSGKVDAAQNATQKTTETTLTPALLRCCVAALLRFRVAALLRCCVAALRQRWNGADMQGHGGTAQTELEMVRRRFAPSPGLTPRGCCRRVARQAQQVGIGCAGTGCLSVLPVPTLALRGSNAHRTLNN